MIAVVTLANGGGDIGGLEKQMGFGRDEGIMAASGCCEKNLVSHNEQ